ncbi:MAG: toll/interleukin-1 receptor domain-containing protein, partial [Geminicoccaceae bacterium]
MAPTPEQKPDAFLSYTRFDDRRGRISDFRTWLSDAVEEVSGKPFEIFQDVDDESGIALGKKWQHELDRMLDEVRFFIPILTPKFFASKACRDEL